MTSILYIPADGDPHGLLAGDDLGGSAPRCADGFEGWIPWSWQRFRSDIQNPRMALALVWNGEVLDLGVARLLDRLVTHIGGPRFGCVWRQGPHDEWMLDADAEGWDFVLYASTGIEGDTGGMDADYLVIQELAGVSNQWQALATVAADILGGSVVVIDND